jgi:hypothetical protein
VIPRRQDLQRTERQEDDREQDQGQHTSGVHDLQMPSGAPRMHPGAPAAAGCPSRVRRVPCAIMSRRLVVLILIGAAVPLLPLAEATPPDQSWVGGFYDNADYDDVVLIVTNAAAIVETGLRWVLAPVAIVVSGVLPADPPTIGLVPRARSSSRAPPAA